MKGVADVGEELAALAYEVESAPEHIARGSHLGRIDVGHRERTTTQQDRRLVRVDVVVSWPWPRGSPSCRAHGRARSGSAHEHIDRRASTSRRCTRCPPRGPNGRARGREAVPRAHSVASCAVVSCPGSPGRRRRACEREGRCHSSIDAGRCRSAWFPSWVGWIPLCQRT